MLKITNLLLPLRYTDEDIKNSIKEKLRIGDYDILSFEIRNARVLDLFSGSGALGLESLSRGAKEVVFNDVSRESIALLKSNLAALKLTVGEHIKLFNYDYSVCLDVVKGEFDFIFLDPPYRFDYGKTALEKIAQKGLLSKDGIAVYERDRPFEGKIDGLQQVDERKYGKTYITFFKKGE